MDKIDEIITRGVENIIPGKEELEKLLRAGKKLNIYLGIDPTATHIHIGNAVPLRKLQKFVDLGHNVTFLIGDFTALIGDTSDKDSERPVLTSEQIRENFKDYKKQAEKILDFSKVSLKHNSEWLSKLTFEDIVKLCQHYSAGDFVSRELIRKRLDEGKKVGLHELLYPVMQGYDSYYMDTDIQIGGTDQTFNMQAGRVLQKDLRNKQSFVVSNPFLMGTDGRKMSKTWNNAIWLDDSPDEMFGKVMSVKDDLIIQYFTLATNTPLEEIAEIDRELSAGKNPMLIKKTLAHRLVTELHSEQSAEIAQKEFEFKFQQKDWTSPEIHLEQIPYKAIIPNNPNISGPTISGTVLTSQLVPSKSDLKRLFQGNAIDLNGNTVTEDTSVKVGDVIKVGKKKGIKVTD